MAKFTFAGPKLYDAKRLVNSLTVSGGLGIVRVVLHEPTK